jgi:hypothetical protein
VAPESAVDDDDVVVVSVGVGVVDGGSVEAVT